MWHLLVLVPLAIAASGQQLRVANAASYQSATRLAAGTMIRVAPEQPVEKATEFRLELRPVQGGALPLLVLGVEYGVIRAVIPPDAPRGAASLDFITAVGRENRDVVITGAAVGIFTGGGGSALAQITRQGAELSLNQLTNPVLPGDIVTLWLTGLGDFSGQDVSVEIGQQSVRPSFAGHAPGQPGVDQINFAIPAPIVSGCYVPLRVRAGSSLSDTVVISTAAARGVCQHPLGLSADQLQYLDRGGVVLMGALLLQHASPAVAFDKLRRESADLNFFWLTAGGLLSYLYPIDAPANCSWVQLGGAGVEGEVLGVSRDAGPAVTLGLGGPAGRSIALPAAPQGREGHYSKDIDPPLPDTPPAALPPAFFGPGEWTLTAPGGAGIGPFRRTFTVPPPLRLTNLESLRSFGRDTDLLVSWDSQGFGPGDAVSIFLQTDGSVQTPNLGATAFGIACTAAAQSGRLVVPRDMLVHLSPTDSADEGRSRLQVIVTPNTARPNVLSVPSVSGGSIPMITGFRSDDVVQVVVR